MYHPVQLLNLKKIQQFIWKNGNLKLKHTTLCDLKIIFFMFLANTIFSFKIHSAVHLNTSKALTLLIRGKIFKENFHLEKLNLKVYWLSFVLKWLVVEGLVVQIEQAKIRI